MRRDALARTPLRCYTGRVSQALLFPDPQPLVERLGKKFFRKIPARAGVYKMRDAQDRILYIGKAKNLRQRLRNYRTASPERMPRRHLRLLQEVVRIEFELCPNEARALEHEAHLIRQLKPRFNRAGVWPGQPRFLAWRFEQSAVALVAPETPPAGWRRMGPLNSGAPRLRDSLARLLWGVLHPHAGFAGLPGGWAKGALGGVVRLDCGARYEAVQMALETHLPFDPPAFVAWLKQESLPPGSVFERAAWQADWDAWQDFATRQAEIPRREGASQLSLL